MVCLIGILFGSMIITSFAQTAYEPGLTVTTNESSYNQGNNIIISGKVSRVIPDALITIQLWKGGDIINTDQIEPDQDGNYSNTLNSRGPMWTQGTYVVRAIYGDQDIAKTLFKLGSFKPTDTSTFFTEDSSETKISVKMNGNDKFYLNLPNQIVRATVEIQNYSPSDENYFMKITHIPTKTIVKESEIMPRYSGNGLWGAQIGHPLFETNTKSLNQTLTGKYMLQINTLQGSKSSSTQFSIFKSEHDLSISTPEPSTPSKVSINARVDKSSYQQGETIQVTGTVSEILFGYAIGISIFSPDDKDVDIIQTLPNPDRTFSYNFHTNKNLYPENGKYKIQLIYGTEDLSKNIFFTFDNSTVVTPEPILEAEPNSGIKPSSGLEKSTFPEWGKNIMQWYLDGKISGDELFLNFQYLVENKIIKSD
jgi:hypothetical protein